MAIANNKVLLVTGGSRGIGAAVVERAAIDGYRIWNLGGSSPIALRDMIDTIADVVGSPAKIEQVEMQPGDVERTWADTTRLEAELGFRPKVSFREGIERQWAWQRSTIES